MSKHDQKIYYLEAFERKSNVGFEETAKSAAILLHKLFDEIKYSDEEKCLYQWLCRTSIENFIYREILSYETPFEIEFKNHSSLDAQKEEFLIRLAVIYFLNERHNNKLDRCSSQKYNLEEFDSYLCNKILNVAYNCPNHPEWREKYYNSLNKEEIFFTASRLLVTYVSDNLRRVWIAPNYSPNNSECYEVTLKIATYKDKEMSSYKELLLYLLSQERNGIGDFSSTELWNNAMDARFSNDQHIEDFSGNDLHLALICLSLGLNNSVYDRLIFLRKKAFGETVRSIKTPVNNEEKNMLNSFLENSRERMLCAKNEAPNLHKTEIVRRVLVNVAVDLMKSGLRPVGIILTDDEIKRTAISKELVEKFYENKNGKRSLKKLKFLKK